MHSPTMLSKECNLLGHPQLLSSPNSLPYLITFPAFRLYKYICVHNYIYIFCPGLGFVPAQTLASLSTVCVR